MTCDIPHYPTQFIDVWRLQDGRRVTVRPILPQDAQPSQQFVRALSQRSRHRRFHAAVNELTPAMLERLTRVDHVRHLALVAERVAQHGTVLVGEARFVCADDPQRAEFAIAVTDDWQGLGMGRRLLEALLRAAAARGVRHLVGDVMRDNRPMLALALQLGSSFDSRPADPGLVRVTIDPLAACVDPDRRADASGASWTETFARRLLHRHKNLMTSPAASGPALPSNHRRTGWKGSARFQTRAPGGAPANTPPPSRRPERNSEAGCRARRPDSKPCPSA